MSQDLDPQWLPDPAGRHQYRWWDGSEWTENVSDAGVAKVDPVPISTTEPVQVEPPSPSPVRRSPAFSANPPSPRGTPPPGQGPFVPSTFESPGRVQNQVAKARAAEARPAQAGGGTIFSEPILVVNQKAKLIEVTAEFAIYNQAGHQIGAIREVGQSSLKKAFRVLSSMDQYMSKQLEVVDLAGNQQLLIKRPAKLIKSRFEVYGPTGGHVGSIIQRNAIGKIRFAFEAGGLDVGGIKAENWRAWNFRIEDHNGTEVARITKTWEGIAKTMFTTADNYVVHIHQDLTEPLRSMVIASALSVDTALKQDQRGWN